MKPILFSPLMVTAIQLQHKTILHRRLKTQTRRLINRYKIQLERDWATNSPSAFSVWDKKSGAQIVDKDECGITLEGVMSVLLGDILYVREHYYAFGLWVKLAEKTKSGKPKWKFIDKTIQRGGQHHFVADGKPDSVAVHTIRDGEERWYKRNSLFMPKEVARIFLKVTNVRIERASDISEADAIAEGIGMIHVEEAPSAYNDMSGGYHMAYIDYENQGEFAGYQGDAGCFRKAKDSFKSLWNSINGPETWNNWVFVYDFEITKKP